MADNEQRLAAYILKEHFGETVEKVGMSVLRKGCQWATLASVKQDTGLSVSKIKKALRVLIQHNLVKFETNGKRGVSYKAEMSCILTIHQYAKLIHCAKEVFGNASELIIEELLRHGSMTMSAVVATVTGRLLDPALSQSELVDCDHIANKFAELVQGHLIKRCLADNLMITSEEDEEDEKSSLRKENSEEYELPLGYIPSVSNDDGPAAKRPKNSSGEISVDYEDANMLWQVNILQFYHYLVNEMIENAVRNRLDEFAAEIVKVMLKLTNLSRDGFAAHTKPVSVFEINGYLSDTSEISSIEITQYLNLLEDDEADFVSKVGENSGGMYVVNIKKCVEAICVESIESVIRERCGSKSLRIFKLLLLKRHLEQKQVEDLIMVPTKEAKGLLYNLLSEKFINLQEVPRATDYAVSRTFHLFSVNIQQVCQMLLDRSYKTVSNLICRRHHETEEQKRLVEKCEKINATILALKSQGIDDDSPAVKEVEEMITVQEKQQLTKLKTVLSKLEQSELQVGDTILTFTHYLALNSS